MNGRNGWSGPTKRDTELSNAAVGALGNIPQFPDVGGFRQACAPAVQIEGLELNSVAEFRVLGNSAFHGCFLARRDASLGRRARRAAGDNPSLPVCRRRTATRDLVVRDLPPYGPPVGFSSVEV